MGRVTDREAFRRRALSEAERYGPDPYVFVRELIQNSRDAGASRIGITVEAAGDGSRVVVEDDGEGMTPEQARRYLFVLYSSSKGGDRRQAGRFGVGFWSVLKVAPRAITVASRARGAAGWGLRFDGALSTAEQVEPPDRAGTRVEIELGADPELVSGEIAAAARRDARFLTHRDDAGRTLPLTVNGVRVNEPMSLPPPSVAFRRGDVRGVVALGPEPIVELFARGLRVRSAATLAELLAPTAAGRAPEEPSPLPGRLFPRVAVACDRLEVLLARGDVRDDRALRRVVTIASRELDRLVRRQIRLSSGTTRLRRMVDGGAEILARHGRAAAGGAGPVARGAAAPALPAGWRRQVPAPVAGEAVSSVLFPGSGPAGPTIELHPYEDLAAHYRGPVADTVVERELALDVEYWPPSERPLLAALRVTDLDRPGSWRASDRASFVPHGGSPCTEGCLSILVRTSAAAGPLRLPVPTGHVIDPASLRIVPARTPELLQSPEGQPALWLDAPFAGTVTYVTGRGPSSIPPLPEPRPALPAEALAPIPASPGVGPGGRLLAVARRLVRYDRSPETARRHREASATGAPLLSRAIAAGAGDCDIVNGALVQMLQATGTPARLAVGFVGRGGRAIPGLHAWAELPHDGAWIALDATATPGADDDMPPAGGGAAWAVALPLASPDGGTQAAADAPGTPGSSPLWSVAILAALLGLVATGGTAAARLHVRRVDAFDRAAPLAALLSGTLAHPEAFTLARAIASRPVVPLLGRARRISLRRARELASRGRLGASWQGSATARRAAARAFVVDASRPEGAVVARSLGAFDLDRWETTAPRCALAAHVTEALHELGEGWELELAPGSGVEVRDRPAFGLGPKLVLVGDEDPLVARARNLLPHRPQAAVLLVLERVAEAISAPGASLRRALAEQAWRALEEAAEPGARGGASRP